MWNKLLIGIIVLSALPCAAYAEMNTAIEDRHVAFHSQFTNTSDVNLKAQASQPHVTASTVSEQQKASAFRTESDAFFEKLLTENRAKTFPVMDNGRTLNYVTHISEYVDGYHTGKRAGNLLVPAWVTNVHNVTVVTDSNVTAILQPIRIGNVTMLGRGGEIVNSVELSGGVTSIFQSVEIGNITIGSQGVGRISNHVEIGRNVRVW